MSRYDLRWAWRHPVGWLRVVWFPLLLAVSLAAWAGIVREPVFDVLVGSAAWPLIFAWTSGVLALSTVAPLDQKIQVVAAGSLAAVATLRAVSYTLALATADLSAAGVQVAAALWLHWTVMVGVAVLLPRLLEVAGRRMTAEAGADDRGGR